MVIFIRDGKKVWPTCPNCGCRLDILENSFFVNLRHFGFGEKDARGCKCVSIDFEWTFQKRIVNHLGYC